MIYQRYLVFEILKTFFLFLFCFYFVYMVIDYSSHMGDFTKQDSLNFVQLVSYYGFHFVKRAEILIPLGLLIATIKVLLNMNQHGELTTLQACGISKKKILKPFIWIGAFACLFNFAIEEYFLPKSLSFLDSFNQEYFKAKIEAPKEKSFDVLYFTDGSKLFYQKEDPEHNAYFDVFWVRSLNDIYRMKYLSKDLKKPTAQYVDHFIRGQDGRLEKVESFDNCRLVSFHVKKNAGNHGVLSLENKKMSELFHLLFYPVSDYLPSEVLTHFLFKLVMPFLGLLAALGPTPFCMRHSRTTPIFLIYAVSLFGMITFCSLMDGAVILGENHTISPFIAILSPICILSAWICWTLKKEVL